MSTQPSLVEYALVVGAELPLQPFKGQQGIDSKAIYQLCAVYGGKNPPAGFQRIEYTLNGSSGNLLSDSSTATAAAVLQLKAKTQTYIAYSHTPASDTQQPIVGIQIVSDKQQCSDSAWEVLTAYDLNRGAIGKSVYFAVKRATAGDDSSSASAIVEVGLLNNRLSEWVDDSVDLGWQIDSQQPLLLPSSFQLVSRRLPTHQQRRYQAAVLQHIPNAQSSTAAAITLPDGLQHFCFPHGIAATTQRRAPAVHSFVSTTVQGTEVYGTALVYQQRLDTADADDTPQYIQRALCLLSMHPLAHQMSSFLLAVSHALDARDSGVSVHALLSQLWQAPLSRSSKLAVQLSVNDTTITLPTISNTLSSVNTTSTSISDTAQVDAALERLFSTLSVRNIMKVYLSLLTERKVIVYSADLDLLSAVGDAFRSLLYPLQWQYAYVPLCPSVLYGALDAPMPVFIGIHSTIVHSSIFDMDDSCCIVQLDRDHVSIHGTPLAELPSVLEKRLYRELLDYAHVDIRSEASTEQQRTRRSMRGSHDVADVSNTALSPLKTSASVDSFLLESPSGHNNHHSSALDSPAHSPLTANTTRFSFSRKRDKKPLNVTGIRAAFLHLFTTLFAAVDSYLLFPVLGDDLLQPTFEQLFDGDTFVAQKPSSLRPFLRTLCRTQCFNTFIEAKTYGTRLSAGAASGSQSLEFFDKCSAYEQEVVTIKRTIEKHGSEYSGLSELPPLCLKLVRRTVEAPAAVYHVPTTSNTAAAPSTPPSDSNVVIDLTQVDTQPSKPSLSCVRMLPTSSKSNNLLTVEIDDQQSASMAAVQQLFTAAFTARTIATTPTSARRNNKQYATLTKPLTGSSTITMAEAYRSARSLLHTTYTVWFELASTLIPYRSDPSAAVVDLFTALSAMTDPQRPTAASVVDEAIYRAVLHTCGRYQKKQEAGMILETMKRTGIRPNALTYGAYTAALNDGTLASSTGGIQYISPLHSPAMKAAQTTSVSSIDWRTCKGGVGHHCTVCHYEMLESEILAYWPVMDAYTAGYQHQCTNCNTAFQPQLQVFVDILQLSEASTRTSCVYRLLYLHPTTLRKELKLLMASNRSALSSLPAFRQSHPVLYWNLLWHVTAVAADSDIMCSYLADSQTDTAQRVQIERVNVFDMQLTQAVQSAASPTQILTFSSPVPLNSSPQHAATTAADTSTWQMVSEPAKDGSPISPDYVQLSPHSAGSYSSQQATSLPLPIPYHLIDVDAFEQQLQDAGLTRQQLIEGGAEVLQAYKATLETLGMKQEDAELERQLCAVLDDAVLTPVNTTTAPAPSAAGVPAASKKTITTLRKAMELFLHHRIHTRASERFGCSAASQPLAATGFASPPPNAPASTGQATTAVNNSDVQTQPSNAMFTPPRKARQPSAANNDALAQMSALRSADSTGNLLDKPNGNRSSNAVPLPTYATVSRTGIRSMYTVLLHHHPQHALLHGSSVQLQQFNDAYAAALQTLPAALHQQVTAMDQPLHSSVLALDSVYQRRPCCDCSASEPRARRRRCTIAVPVALVSTPTSDPPRRRLSASQRYIEMMAANAPAPAGQSIPLSMPVAQPATHATPRLQAQQTNNPPMSSPSQLTSDSLLPPADSEVKEHATSRSRQSVSGAAASNSKALSSFSSFLDRLIDVVTEVPQPQLPPPGPKLKGSAASAAQPRTRQSVSNANAHSVAATPKSASANGAA